MNDTVLNEFQNPVPVESLDAQKRAELLPLHYFKTISNQSGLRVEPSLVFTKENVLSIRRYVERVNALPRTLESLEEITDFKLLELSPEYFHALYERLRENVLIWDYLEGETKILSRQIEIFSKSTFANGQALLNEIEAMPACQNLKAVPASLNELEYNPVKLTADEKQQAVTTIAAYLGEIQSDIENTLRRIDAVKDRATNFATIITKELRPDVRNSIKKLNDAKNPARVSSLYNQATQLSLAIDLKKQEYHAAVGNAFTGVFFMGVGLLFTGGYFGSKAEGIRAEKNAMIAERDALLAKAEGMEPALLKLEVMSADMCNLEISLKEVEESAKNLVDVWRDIGGGVADSLDDSHRIDDVIALKNFTVRFGNVIRPWQEIGHLSAGLSKLFNAALDDEVSLS